MQLKCKKIWAACGEGAVTNQMCQKWFGKLCAGGSLLAAAPSPVDQWKETVIKSGR